MKSTVANDRPRVPTQFRAICQPELPFYPWMDKVLGSLPGMRPLEPRDWLLRDAVFAPQMAYRDWLIANRRGAVLAELPGAAGAAAELLQVLLDHLRGDARYAVSGHAITRPDGVAVGLGQGEDPLATVGRLVQEDFCLLERDGSEHVLTAAVLCFPASWTLAEKLGKPLTRIHRPVPAYSDDLANRVQRIFDRMRPGALMMRANTLVYDDPDLHQPRSEASPKRLSGEDRWIRVERQTLRKLPRSGAVVFGIHSSVVPAASLPESARNSPDAPI